MNEVDALSFPLERCKGCPHGFARIVGHRGPLDSPLVIVGESPGKQELKEGLPFMGPSGKVLEHALSQYPQITPLFCNAIQCYPGTSKAKNQDKVTEATHVCQARLQRLIGCHPRRAILALGNPAVWSTTDDFRTKITQVRGKIFHSRLSGNGIVASVHPAFLLRGGGSMRQFMADVDYACRIALHGESATKRYIVPEVRVAKTPRDVWRLAQGISQYLYCSVDTETGGFQGFDFLRDRILCAGFCVSPEVVYVVPEELIRHTKEIFIRAPNTRFIWHNGKFDQKFFWASGVMECRVDEDTMLLSYAIDETKGIHDLEQLASDILGAPDWKFMIKKYLGKGKTYADIPRPILYDYMAKDISGTLQIFPFLRAQVRQDDSLEKLYTKTLLPQSLYMSRIEFKGIAPDLEQVQKNKVRMQANADKLEATFQQFAADHGTPEINPRSPKQVAAFLYQSLALRDRRTPKRIPESTDEDTLRALQPEDHPAVVTLLQYRKVQKGLSTYVNSLEENVGADGRIHTSYLIHGTTTGRPASRDPNLLNIPREASLRDQFRAAEGHILMEVDINQAELRVLADLSRDKMLHTIYTTPKHPSIHDVTRIEMYGDPKDYTDADWEHWIARFNANGNRKFAIHEQKMRAKTVNFGIVYGRTAESVAEEFEIPVKEAAEWMRKWFGKYEGAGHFINACRSAPLRGQNLVTPFGFKRRFQLVSPEKAHDMQNQAANFPEQSIAWHCTLHTGMLIQRIARFDYNAYIVNTVYDSILFETPDDRDRALELGCRVLNLLAEVPKRWGLVNIPFKGDIKLGHSWGSLEEAEIPPHIISSVNERWPLGIYSKDFTG